MACGLILSNSYHCLWGCLGHLIDYSDSQWWTCRSSLETMLVASTRSNCHVQNLFGLLERQPLVIDPPDARKLVVSGEPPSVEFQNVQFGSHLIPALESCWQLWPRPDDFQGFELCGRVWGDCRACRNLRVCPVVFLLTELQLWQEHSSAAAFSDVTQGVWESDNV